MTFQPAAASDKRTLPRSVVAISTGLLMLMIGTDAAIGARVWLQSVWFLLALVCCRAVSNVRQAASCSGVLA